MHCVCKMQNFKMIQQLVNIFFAFLSAVNIILLEKTNHLAFSKIVWYSVRHSVMLQNTAFFIQCYRSDCIGPTQFVNSLYFSHTLVLIAVQFC